MKVHLHGSWNPEPELSREHDAAHIRRPYAEGEYVQGPVGAGMGVRSTAESRNDEPLFGDKLVADPLSSVEGADPLG
ncbi:hypothetical protein MASR2M79_10980 [Aminivibrio sp.]